MNEDRGLEQVGGLLVSVVAVCILLVAGLLLLLGGDAGAGSFGETGPQILGFTVTMLVVIVWLVLSRR